MFEPRQKLLIALALLLPCCSDGEKRATNEQCTANTDCADNICHRGICASTSPADNGQPCAGAGSCLSYNCKSDTCAPGQLAGGASCLNGQECSSKICNGGTCGGTLPPDGGAPPDMSKDALLPDQAPPKPDAPVPDIAATDAPVPDTAILDLAPPDLPPPDAPQPDMVQPDMLQPDMVQPDLPQQDLLPPDMVQSDMTSSDAGGGYSAWKNLTIPTTFIIWSVAASGNLILIAGMYKTGGVIYRSSDGGKIWNPASLFATKSGIVNLAMEGNDVAAVDNEGKIWVSKDGGKIFNYVHDCWSLGGFSAVAIHNGHVLAGGRNKLCWAATPTGPYSDQDLTKITTKVPSQAVSQGVALTTYKGKITGLSVGYSGKIGGWHYVYRNSGMGSTWADLSAKLSATSLKPQAVSFASTGQVWALEATGVLHLSMDSGDSWVHGSAGSGAKKTYSVSHEIPAGSGAARVLVSGQTSHLSVNGGLLFSTVQGLPKIWGRLDTSAFNGQGKVYMGERYGPSGTSLLLEGKW